MPKQINSYKLYPEIKLPSPIVEIKDDFLIEAKVKLFLKRDDLIHPQISGNKWRKLFYNIEQAINNKASGILTFGGAFSNHLTATAFACKIAAIPAIGIVRGAEIDPNNPSIQFIKENKMQLHFISREKYRLKNELNFQNELKSQFGKDLYIIPEGGSNQLAIKGCMEIIPEIQAQFNGQLPQYICSSVGSGGSISGIIVGANGQGQTLGFSALKGEFLQSEIKDFILDYNQTQYNNWTINTDYHFGGFAKWKKELIDFINEFKQRHQIQLEPIYTGKMMYGIYDLIQKGYFEKGSNILAIHTGGLQGIAGFNNRFGQIIH